MLWPFYSRGKTLLCYTNLYFTDSSIWNSDLIYLFICLFIVQNAASLCMFKNSIVQLHTTCASKPAVKMASNLLAVGCMRHFVGRRYKRWLTNVWHSGNYGSERGEQMLLMKGNQESIMCWPVITSLWTWKQWPVSIGEV
jgi:hypothetical protein